MHDALKVVAYDGRRIDSNPSLLDGEDAQAFAPSCLWSDATTHIPIDARFEDVAGNSFHEKLDQVIGSEARDFDRMSIPVQPKISLRNSTIFVS